ncbi:MULTISPECIES: anthranilate synthase component II [Candidatus Protochlamydia]|uniref:anthranilate synthase component II n=1 Tax=Candidatus Protochlamydia TaxID=282132 RepID=UPI00057F7B25|nr:MULTISPECIES: aminodeoxychorismate/anthranilate synthase component II [Protochlamydia]
MLLFIDNFDSFTYNLVQYFQMLGSDVKVLRNQGLSLSDCLTLRPTHLVIGPGPGTPSEAGISQHLIRKMAGRLPILGICLGHQVLAEAYGGKVVKAVYPMHGKSSFIYHDSQGIFRNIPQSFKAIRYHSLIVKHDNLPHCLDISATTKEGEIMGLRHHFYDIESVQFHPESIMTEHGFSLLRNFLDKPLLTL